MPANPLARRRDTGAAIPRCCWMGPGPSSRTWVNTARDKMVMTWLSDTSLRIGGLTGLHLVDMHLRDNALCGDCRSLHVPRLPPVGNATGTAP